MSLMLHPLGIAVPDRPPGLFKFGHAQHARYARAFVADIEMLMPDDVAWERLFTDDFRLQLFRTTHGNRPTPKPRPERVVTPPVPTLFDEAA